jgi:hypothetical protein
VPIGGGSTITNMPEEFATTNQDTAVDNSGPIEERLVSKSWNVRANAFDELANSFKISDSPSD